MIDVKFSQNIKPVARILLSDYESFTIPEDEIWYARVNLPDYNAYISPDGITSTESERRYNLSNRRNGDSAPAPLLMPGGTTITADNLNSGSDNLRVSGWDISEIVDNKIVAGSLGRGEYVDVPDGEVWHVRLSGRSANAGCGHPDDVTLGNWYQHMFHINQTGGDYSRLVLQGGERLMCTWTNNNGNDEIYYGGFVVREDADTGAEVA